jgi:nucleoside diphosphate kinase
MAFSEYAQPRQLHPDFCSQHEIGPFQRSFVILKPHNFRLIPEIGAVIEESGLEITRGTTLNFSKKQAEALYKEHLGKEYYSSLIALTYGEVFLFEVVGNNAISVIRNEVIKKVRCKYGINSLQDIVHAPDGPVAYQRESSVLSLK